MCLVVALLAGEAVQMPVRVAVFGHRLAVVQQRYLFVLWVVVPLAEIAFDNQQKENSLQKESKAFVLRKNFCYCSI